MKRMQLSIEVNLFLEEKESVIKKLFLVGRYCQSYIGKSYGKSVQYFKEKGVCMPIQYIYFVDICYM